MKVLLTESTTSAFKLLHMKRPAEDSSQDEPRGESFIQCPKAFLLGRNPEDIVELRQIYSFAYRMAIESCRGPAAFHGGEGI
jgi:hypothetical protein